MDFKQIQELIKLINKSEISELKIEQDGFKITIRANGFHRERQSVTYLPAAAPAPAPQQQLPVEQVVQTAHAQETATPTSPKTEGDDLSGPHIVTIKSPMIGTFYRRPSPDKEPFVQVGDVIKKGKPICVIEAMKLFNEIESEHSGKIVKVMLEDSSPVEYDQPLFLIDTSAS